MSGNSSSRCPPIPPMSSIQSPNPRAGSLQIQKRHPLAPLKPRNPRRPKPQSRKQPSSQSESASPQRNERNELGHAPLRTAARRKPTASANIAGNLPYQGKLVAHPALNCTGKHGNLDNRKVTTKTTRRHDTPPDLSRHSPRIPPTMANPSNFPRKAVRQSDGEALKSSLRSPKYL